MDPATIAISITGSIVSGVASGLIVAGISVRLAKTKSINVENTEKKIDHSSNKKYSTATHDTSDAQ